MYYNGKELDLKGYLAERRKNFTESQWDEEGEIWSIQEYESSMGAFSSEDAEYLNGLGYSVEDFEEC